MIDDSRSQECVGVVKNVFRTVGDYKITLDGSVIYYFDVWVGSLVDQEVILGIDCIVSAKMCLDIAMKKTFCLLDLTCSGLAGPIPPYRITIQVNNSSNHHAGIHVGIQW